MPEGPELFLSSLYINRTCGGMVFSGKVVKNPIHKCLDVAWNELTYTISAESRGKELMLHLQSCHDSNDDSPEKTSKNKECSILFTFGMSGKFAFTTADNLPKHSHLTFFTRSEPKMGLAFVDYRRFGKWIEGGKWSNERGPCVIQDHDRFINNVADNLNNNAFSKPICEVMLNQKFFNGIGNYLRAEILFRCKVPPFEKARSVLTLKETKQESNDTYNQDNNTNGSHPIDDKKEIKNNNICPNIESMTVNGCPSVKKRNALSFDVSKTIKMEAFDEHRQPGSSLDLFTPEAQELLKICGSVPHEVIDIGSTKYSLSELYKDDTEGKSFDAWLQCYYQDGMKNMADHNNRTIWFSGPAGPMAPKEQKVRGKKINKKKVAKEEGKGVSIEQESPNGQEGKKGPRVLPSTLTRTKLKEYKQKTNKAMPGKNASKNCEKVIVEKSRKRSKETSSDLPSGKKTKKIKTVERVPASRRQTRSSVKVISRLR